MLILDEGEIMMVERFEINPDVLKFYIIQSRIPLEVIRTKEKNIDLYLSGEKKPTFNQLSSIAKILNTPTGLLLLEETIDNQITDLDFRTVDSDHLDGFSSELTDTINEMKVKQDFLREEVENELPFVGKFTIDANYMKVADSIRETINISSNYFENIQEAHFSYLRKKVNEAGVFIFLNGKVKDNTHRPLDLKEFRGFVLSDKKAPIIFINQTDSRNGQTFTLMHELVHLFLNENEIFNVIEIKEYSSDPIEFFVNKVTAELLVPEKYILNETSSKIDELSKRHGVSKFVIARRFYDLRVITKEKYNSLILELNKELEDIPKRRTSSGGNYNNNLNFRMDKPFVNYIENAINSNRISYTDAFDILGVGYKGFKTLMGGNS